MIPHKEFISSRAKQFLAKSGPMATLSRPAGFPEAQERVLQSASQLQRPFRRDRKPKRGSWPANGHFYQRGSSQGASPVGLSHGWQIPYDPTQRIYQQPGQAIFSQKRPDGHFIKASWLPREPKRGSFRALASSNGRFVARKSLQPSLELSSAACSRRNCHSQPSTPRRPARASRSCDTRAHFSLGCGVIRPSNVAAARQRSQRADNGLLPACAASKRPSARCRPLAFEADRPRVASFPRARLPQSKALVQPSQLRPQAENVSATPSVEIAAALASTMAHRSKLLQPSAPRRPEERVWLPSARNFGFKPVLQLSRGKRFCDSARSSCSARLALARKSLQPSLELSSAACSRRNCHSQPSTPRRPARASRSCDTRAHFSLGCGVNRPSNVAAARDSRSSSRRRLRMQTSSVCAFARSSASRITRPAGVQIKTLNPKRFVSGRYWGGLKQPPRRAAPRPSLGRGAPLPRANPKP